MSLDIAGVPGIELAVDQRMQHNFRFIAFHGAVPEAMAGPGRVVTIRRHSTPPAEHAKQR